MSEQEFESYLRLMGRFLHFSDTQRETIGRELRSHMDERMEELIARGYTRDDAIDTILDEFGDAAALAGEFGRIGTRRKWIMRTTVGTFGIAAAVLLVSFLLPENRPLPGPSYSHAGQQVGISSEDSPVAAEAARTGLLVGGDNENTTDQDTRYKLSRTVSVEYPEGTSFEEFLGFMRDTGDVSIVVNWSALAVHGIDRTADIQGLDVKNAKLETVLELVLENVGGPENTLTYTITDGIVRISSIDQLERNAVVRVYDVSDLIQRDLPATVELAVRENARRNFHEDADAIAQKIESRRVEQLRELITTTVEPETWQPKGSLGSFSYYEGLLVITHTPRAHQELADLLGVMRKALAARPTSGATASAISMRPPAGGIMGGFAMPERPAAQPADRADR